MAPPRTLPPARLVGIGAGYGSNGRRENYFKGMMDEAGRMGRADGVSALPVS